MIELGYLESAVKSGRRLIVFEAQPYWQPELQRRFLNDDVEVAGCRSISDVEKRLRQIAADAVILDLSADVSGVLRWMAAIDERSGPVPIIVVLSGDHRSLDWRIRELGATAIVDEFIGGSRMAAVCRKTWRNSVE